MFNIPMGSLLSAMADNDKDRAILSSARGFGSAVGNAVPVMLMPMLIEKYAGAFPFWLSPVQVKVLSLTERTADYAKEIADNLVKVGIRAEADTRNEKLGYKIREAQLEKIPYMLIVGDKEKEEKTVSVRSRKDGDLGVMGIEDLTKKLIIEDRTKKI